MVDYIALALLFGGFFLAGIAFVLNELAILAYRSGREGR